MKNLSQHVLVKTKAGKTTEKIIEGNLEVCRNELDKISRSLVGGSPIMIDDTLFKIITKEEFIRTS